MISVTLGIIVTLAGIFGGEALVERFQLGPRSCLALGWLMGMTFVLATVIVAIVTGGQP
jgi:hypothetical protein